MRKYLILLCVLALICGTVVYARMNVGILCGSVPVGGGECSYTSKDAVTATTEGDLVCGGGSSGRGAAIRYTTTSAYDTDRITVALKKTGAPSCTVVVLVYNDSGDLPNTLLATSTTTLDCATEITTSFADYDFDFDTPASLDTTTLYWIAIVSTVAGTCNSENYVSEQNDSSGGGTGSRFAYSTVYAPSWSVIDDGWKMDFDAQDCE